MPPTTGTFRSPLDLSLLLGCDQPGKPMTHDSAAAPLPVCQAAPLFQGSSDLFKLDSTGRRAFLAP